MGQRQEVVPTAEVVGTVPKRGRPRGGGRPRSTGAAGGSARRLIGGPGRLIGGDVPMEDDRSLFALLRAGKDLPVSLTIVDVSQIY